MKLKTLFEDDEAVSPVIGVILMVAITVILAAVIGTFVLGLGDQVQTTAPNAQFSDELSTITFDGGGANSYEFNQLAVTHESGETIEESTLEVTVDGNPALVEDNSGNSVVAWDGNGDVSSGSGVDIVAYYTGDEFTSSDSVNLNDDADNDESYTDGETEALTTDNIVRVTWNSEDGSTSSTLVTREIN